MDNPRASEGKSASADRRSPIPFHRDWSPDTYFLVVGLLLVTIIASLAVLWVRERRRRVVAEAQVARLAGQKRQMQGVLEQIVARQAAQPGPAIRREDVPSRVGVVDGQRRSIFTIGAAAGERVGFQPGDVIVVGEPPATSPASRGANPDGTGLETSRPPGG